MKVIDILNKIANGEEVPEKILYSDKIWYWATRENEYVEDYKRLFKYYLDECLISSLNDEIEIIEEDEKIEKLIEPIASEYTYDYVKKVCHKINEIIDYLNKGGDNNVM